MIKSVINEMPCGISLIYKVYFTFRLHITSKVQPYKIRYFFSLSHLTVLNGGQLTVLTYELANLPYLMEAVSEKTGLFQGSTRSYFERLANLPYLMEAVSEKT